MKTKGTIEFEPHRTYVGLDLRRIFDGAVITFPEGKVPPPVPGVRILTWAEEKRRPMLESGRETGDVVHGPSVDLKTELHMDPNMGRTNE